MATDFFIVLSMEIVLDKTSFCSIGVFLLKGNATTCPCGFQQGVECWLDLIWFHF
jgi:hypothetical protein